MNWEKKIKQNRNLPTGTVFQSRISYRTTGTAAGGAPRALIGSPPATVIELQLRGKDIGIRNRYQAISNVFTYIDERFVYLPILYSP